MHARQIGPLNLGAKPYVRQKSQIVFVGAGYRVLLAATDSNQRPVNGPSRSLAAAAYHTRRLGSERGICRSWLAWRRGANRNALPVSQLRLSKEPTLYEISVYKSNLPGRKTGYSDT